MTTMKTEPETYLAPRRAYSLARYMTRQRGRPFQVPGVTEKRQCDHCGTLHFVCVEVERRESGTAKPTGETMTIGQSCAKKLCVSVPRPRKSYMVPARRGMPFYYWTDAQDGQTYFQPKEDWQTNDNISGPYRDEYKAHKAMREIMNSPGTLLAVGAQ